MRKFFLFITIILFLFCNVSISFAQNNPDVTDLQKKIQEYQSKLTELRQQKSSLSSEIQYMDTQIYLTGLKIQETEQKIELTQKEIELLNSKIEGLDTSLSYLAKLLLKRIVEGYKQHSVSFLDLLLDSSDASDLIGQIKYQKTAQENNQKILVQVQRTKMNFEEQKILRETKIKELDTLKAQLDIQKNELNYQKAAKQRLLIETQSNEQVYQNLLAQAQAEYTAIQGIIAGSGTETKMRDVGKGQAIASVIQGSSCNSSGSHLHFIVQENDSVANPFSYLKSVSIENCSGSSCGAGDGDAVNPSGSWDWPIPDPIKLNQGYGSTWAVRNTWVGRIYSFHNGIDIEGSSNTVTAVADGELYRGVYAVGCALSYAKLVHKDSNIVTYYLHVYPQ